MDESNNQNKKEVSNSSERAANQEEARETKRSASPSKRAIWIMRIGAVSAAVVIIAVVAVLVLNSFSSSKKEASAQKEAIDKGPILETRTIAKAPSTRKIVLLGETRPYFQTTVFARVAGYLDQIHVLEGDVIKKGQVLATIRSPEIEQAVQGARADAVNKNRIAARFRVLLKQEYVSPQEAEQAFAAARIAQATLARAQQDREYQTLRAPFDGVITARLVDPGALIPNASNSKSSQLAVVNIADTSRLKIDGYVEQRYASDVFVGQDVQLALPTKLAEKYHGQISRVSGVLDPRTRMLFVEVDFDNSEQSIVSGSFVNMEITVERPELLSVPIQALLSKDGKPALAVVGRDKKVKLQPIEIYENDGTNVMILSGAREGWQVAMDAGSELKDGDTIQPVLADSKKEEKRPTVQMADQPQKAGSQETEGTSSATTQKPEATK